MLGVPIWLLLFSTVIAIFFVYNPQIDVLAAAYFYDPTGLGRDVFFMRQDFWVQFLYDFGNKMTIKMGIVWIFLLLLALLPALRSRDKQGEMTVAVNKQLLGAFIIAMLTGHGWYLNLSSAVWQFIGKALIILVIITIFLFICRKLSLLRGSSRIRVRWLIFMLAALLIGPALLVNAIFKDNWHRPRPRQIEEFGGPYQHSPAFVIVPPQEKTRRNTSFPCGHATNGFYLSVLAFGMKRYRRTVFILGFLLGVMMGIGRMAQGGHFLSDVIFAFVFTYIPAKILYWMLFERQQKVPIFCWNCGLLPILQPETER